MYWWIDRRRIRRPTGSAAAKLAEKSALKNVTSSTASVAKAQDRVDLASSPSTNRFNRRKRPTSLASSASSTDVKVSKEGGKIDKDGYKIVCYYTNWSQYRVKIGKFLPEDIPADLCTHIIFAFGWLKKGRLSSFESNDETKDGKVGLYDRIIGLKKANPSLKVRERFTKIRMNIHHDNSTLCQLDSPRHRWLVIWNTKIQGNVRNTICSSNVHLLSNSILETTFIRWIRYGLGISYVILTYSFNSSL